MSVAAHRRRLAALSRANDLRSRRAQLKAELKAEQVRLADVLLSDEDWLAGMRVREILLATPSIGTTKAGRAMRNCWMSDSARLGRTPKKTRERLLDELLGRSPQLAERDGMTPVDNSAHRVGEEN